MSTSYPILSKSILDNYYAKFANRMMNELTREAALKGLTMVALNGLHHEADAPVIPISNPDQFLPAFFDLLKKQQRSLHLNTLECLEALTRRYKSQLSSKAQEIQNEICAMISDQDLQKANVALKIATNLIEANSDASAHRSTIAKAIDASSSEVITGSVKETIKNFFKVAAKAEMLEQGEVQMLLASVDLKKQCAAACVAICLAHSSKFQGTLDQLWMMIGSQDPKQLVVSALTIGEYGKIKDLSGEQRILPTVQLLFSNP